MADDFTIKGEIELDSSKVNQQLNDVRGIIEKTFDKHPVEDFENSIMKTSQRISGLAESFAKVTAIAAGGFGLTSLVSQSAAVGDAVYKLSNRFGVTAAEAAQFTRILSLTGGSASTAMRAISRLDSTMMGTTKTSEEARAVLNAVGVSLTDASGRLLPLNEQMKQLATGYDRATQAGYGQEFIMKTLGVRGLALVGTLKEYNEAAKIASSVKGVGIDPAQMHQLNITIKQVDMQLSQLRLVAGIALAPLAQEILGTVLPALQQTAQWISRNKDEISEVIKTIAELTAAYETIKLALSAISQINAFRAMVTSIAEARAATTELTAAQTEQMTIAANAANNYYTQMAEKAVATANTSMRAADEFTAKVTEDFAKINGEASASANVVRTSMSEAFLTAGEAAGVATARTNVLSQATVRSGNVAVNAGARAAESAVSATGKVQLLTKAVFELAGGWMTVAAAIGYAFVKLVEYKKEKAEKELNDGVVNIDGNAYTQTENGWAKRVLNPDATDGESPYDYVTIDPDSDEARRVNEYLMNANINQKDNTDAITANTQSLDDFRENLENLMSGVDAEEPKAAKSAGSAKAENVSDSPEMQAMKFFVSNGFTVSQAAGIVGNFMQESSMNPEAVNPKSGAYGIGQWLGDRQDKLYAFAKNTGGDARSLATQLAYALYELNGTEGYAKSKILSSGATPEDAAVAADTYYERSEGTTTWDREVYARQVYDAYQNGGSVMSEAQAAIKQQERIDNAQKELQKLESDLKNSANEVTSTAYENEVNKLNADVNAKQEEIKKIKGVSDTIDTSNAEKLLKEYKDARLDEINKKWQESLDQLKEKTAVTVASIGGDYKSLADAQYNQTVKQAELEEQENIKKLSRYKDDKEALQAAEDAKTARVLEATQRRTEAYREAFQKQIQYEMNNGDTAGFAATMNSQDAKDYFNWNSQKEAMQEYYSLWEQSQMNSDVMMVNFSKDMKQSMDTLFNDLISGSKTIGETIGSFFLNLAKSVISQITSMWSANIAKSILGNFLGMGNNNKTAGKQGNQLLNSALGNVGMGIMQRGVGSLFGGNKNSATSLLGSFAKKSNPLSAFEKSLNLANVGLKGNVKMLSNFMNSTGASNDALGLFNTVQGVINDTTKPEESATTITTTVSLRAMSEAATEAAIAMKSMSMTGGFHLATGGAILGAGTSTSDDIPAMLSNGEYVLNAAAVERVGIPTLDAINDGRVRHFATGGFVSAVSSGAVPVSSPNVNFHISTLDAQSFASFLKRTGYKSIKQAIFNDTRNFGAKSGVW